MVKFLPEIVSFFLKKRKPKLKFNFLFLFFHVYILYHNHVVNVAEGGECFFGFSFVFLNDRSIVLLSMCRL
jgi:hypothetical protein